MSLIDDAVKSVQGAATSLVNWRANVLGGAAQTASNVVSGASSAIGGAASSIGGAVGSLPRVSLPNISVPNINVAQSIKMPTINLPSMDSISRSISNIPTISNTITNIPNIARSVSSIKMPEVNLPQVPDSLRRAAMVTAPVSLVPTISAGATFLATNALKSVPAAPAIRDATAILKETVKKFPVATTAALIPVAAPLALAGGVATTARNLMAAKEKENRPGLYPLVKEPTQGEWGPEQFAAQIERLRASGNLNEGVSTSQIKTGVRDSIWAADKFSDYYAGFKDNFYGSTGIGPIKESDTLLTRMKKSAATPITAPMELFGGFAKHSTDIMQTTFAPPSGKVLDQYDSAVSEFEGLQKQQSQLWESARKDGYVKVINGEEKFVIPEGDQIAIQRFNEIDNIYNQSEQKVNQINQLSAEYESISEEEQRRSIFGKYEDAEKKVGGAVSGVLPSYVETGYMFNKLIADPLYGKSVQKRTGLLPSEHWVATSSDIFGIGNKGLTVRNIAPDGTETRTVYGFDRESHPTAASALEIGSVVTGNVWDSPREKPIMTAAMFALPGVLRLAEIGGGAAIAGMAARGGRVGQIGRYLMTPGVRDAYGLTKVAIGAKYATDVPLRVAGYEITSGDTSSGFGGLALRPIEGVDRSPTAQAARAGSITGSEIIPVMLGAGIVMEGGNILGSMQRGAARFTGSASRAATRMSGIRPRLTAATQTTTRGFAERVPQRLQNTWINLNWRTVSPTGGASPTGGGSQTRGFADFFARTTRSAVNSMNTRVWRATHGVTAEPHGSYTGPTVDVTGTYRATQPTGGGAGRTTFSDYFSSIRSSARNMFGSSSSSRSNAIVVRQPVPAGGTVLGQQRLITAGEQRGLIVNPRYGLRVYEQVVSDPNMPIREVVRSPVTTSSEPLTWNDYITQRMRIAGTEGRIRSQSGTITPRSSVVEQTSSVVDITQYPRSTVELGGRVRVSEMSHTRNIRSYNPSTNEAVVDNVRVVRPSQYEGVDVSRLPIRETTGTRIQTGERVTYRDRVLPDGRLVERTEIWTERGRAVVESPATEGVQAQRDNLARALDRMEYSRSVTSEGVNPFTGERYAPERVTATAARTMRTSPQLIVGEDVGVRPATRPTVRVVDTTVDTTTRDLVPSGQASTTPDIFRLTPRQRVTGVINEGGDVVGRTGGGTFSRRSIYNPTTEEIYVRRSDGGINIFDARTGDFVGEYRSVETDSITTVFERMIENPESVTPSSVEQLGYAIRNSGRRFAADQPRSTSRRPFAGATGETTGRTPRSRVVPTTTGGTETSAETITQAQSARANAFMRRVAGFASRTATERPIGATEQLPPGATEQPSELAFVSQLRRSYRIYNDRQLIDLRSRLVEDLNHHIGSEVPSPTAIHNTRVGIGVIDSILTERGSATTAGRPVTGRSAQPPDYFTPRQREVFTEANRTLPGQSDNILNNIGRSLRREINELLERRPLREEDANRISDNAIIISVINGIIVNRGTRIPPIDIPPRALPHVETAEESARTRDENTAPVFISSAGGVILGEVVGNRVTPISYSGVAPYVSQQDDSSSTTAVTPYQGISPVVTPKEDDITATDHITTTDQPTEMINREDTVYTPLPTEYFPPTEPPITTTTPLPPIIPPVIIPPEPTPVEEPTPPICGGLIPPLGGSGGAGSAGGVAYYGFTEYTPMKTPADIIAAWIGYGRSRRTPRKRKLEKSITMSFSDFIGEGSSKKVSTRKSTKPAKNVFKLDTPIESAIDRAMDTFLSTGKNTNLVPRKQSYNTRTTTKRGSKSKSPKKAPTKKQPVKKTKTTLVSPKRSKRQQPVKPKSTENKTINNRQQTTSVAMSNKYLIGAGKKTSKWLGV